jgi:hypothetical protein
MTGSMKKSAFIIFVVLTAAVLLGGCQMLLEKPVTPDSLSGETGQLSVTIAGSPAASGPNPGRTMLALNPEFSRYELTVSPDPDTGAGSKNYSSGTGSFQLTLPVATYTISAVGYTGDRPSARTWDSTARAIKTQAVTVTAGAQAQETLTLNPYMEDDVFGTLQYSLNWETVGQIPTQAELLIEQYAGDDVWNAIPISLITGDASAGSRRGTVMLLQRSAGLVKQTGSLQLPPGEYRLTTTVTMDGPWPPVSRTDIAHIYSNLITPAAFFYGAGDLTVTNPGLDTAAGFITRFNFTQTPGAPSIVGSAPGPDGTRLIMVTVPTGTNLTQLTPVVECVPGAQIISPAPSLGPDNAPYWPRGDYSRPTTWIAQGSNGVTQQYTVVVAEAAAGDCLITDIAFQEVRLTSAPLVDQSARSITVVVPYGTRAANPNYELTPVFSYIGKEVKYAPQNAASGDTSLTKITFMNGGTPARNFRVYAQDGATKLYTVQILEAASGDAEITGFVFDGYPGYPGTINQTTGAIAVELPYGTPVTSLKPLITYKGRLSPGSGVEQNFSVPVNYTVTSETSVTKPYRVTVTTKQPSSDTGIFDFVITNVPRAKVVIGTKPRADGKIPIVVSVPYATAPLTTPTPPDDAKTDLMKLIPKITLPPPPATHNQGSYAWLNPDNTPMAVPTYIPFGNQNDYQEAVFRVTAEDNTTFQDYVVVVARDVHYYYVKATGNDQDPDQYNGGSESTPFKTLAYAVQKSVEHNVDHIFVIGTLNDASEGGAYEDTSTVSAGGTGGFTPTGGASVITGEGPSVFNIKGAGLDGSTPRHIYITGVGSGAVLQGTGGKRVISITGGARITFDNITIQGGGSTSYGGNGGGIYAGGGSTIVWKSGSVTGNTAKAGGGLYLDGDTDSNPDNDSEFDFMTGAINGNTATGSAVVRSTFETNAAVLSIQGGGGVYINGNALFWLKNGEINSNSTAGSGGGVLLNGSAIPNHPTADNTPNNFIMSAGTVDGNTATGGVWPHGGGGVFVAKGSFEMLGGHIMNNASNRQGGGVFVWSRALFYAMGDSSMVGNKGRGSAKARCCRGITTMRGNAQADSVYVWNYAKGSWNNSYGDEFTLMEGARVSGLVLAFADDPQDNRNYINIVESGEQFFTGGTDRITTIDLESHLLANGSFAKDATVAGDWVGKYLIKNGGQEIPLGQAADILKRFPLGSFTYGGATQSLSAHTLDTKGILR